MKTNVTLPDGSVRSYDGQVTAMDVAKSISEGLARNVLSAKVNGEVRDANRPLPGDCTLALLTWNDTDGKATMWHSSAHVMAEAVEALYPGAKFGIGPAIENGCNSSFCYCCRRRIDTRVCKYYTTELRAHSVNQCGSIQGKSKCRNRLIRFACARNTGTGNTIPRIKNRAWAVEAKARRNEIGVMGLWCAGNHWDLRATRNTASLLSGSRC